MANLNYIIENMDEAVFRDYGDKNNAGGMLGIANSTRNRKNVDVIFENKILEFKLEEDHIELVGARHIFNMRRKKDAEKIAELIYENNPDFAKEHIQRRLEDLPAILDSWKEHFRNA